ncbi:dTTP/UTP pyrophosphatase [Geodia barretti]|uniref:dTTP/UTP pyrophosphatase n=1 Tax=Geodia barretti TaxID=519541 RepID=A0AA35WBG8_GEOBA|nr:dTTP/UTP pyrophosphatase [Geodia barretti]
MFPQTHHVECVATLTLKPTAADVVLASASPRRRELLSGLGIKFRVAPSNIPEDQLPDESATDMVRRLSREKALASAENPAPGYYIGADSTVVLNGESIAKPADAEDARAMLTRLRGTQHQVITGMTIFDAATGRCLTDSMSADVLMREFTDAEMEHSIASGTPMDKAGAYAIQDDDFRPANLLHGCYSNVMGWPVCRVVEMLADLGYNLPSDTDAPSPTAALASARFAYRMNFRMTLRISHERIRHRHDGNGGDPAGCVHRPGAGQNYGRRPYDRQGGAGSPAHVHRRDGRCIRHG